MALDQTTGCRHYQIVGLKRNLIGENLVSKKTTTNKQKVTFSLAAPQAAAVLLVGDFTGWEQSPVALKKLKGGLWKTAVSLSPGTYEYRFLVDGQWRDDPACTARHWNQFGSQNCLCVVGVA